MAKENEKYYSSIVYSKGMQVAFLTVTATVFTIVTLMITANTIGEGRWTTVVIPICLFVIPVVLFPPIELWDYKPWQAKARKYELHYLD